MSDLVTKLDALVDAIKALHGSPDPRVRILLGSHEADDLRAEALRLSNDIAESRAVPALVLPSIPARSIAQAMASVPMPVVRAAE